MLRVVEHTSLTDVGRQRSANEDACFEGDPVFAVADGMGGARAGEVAAQAAVEALAPLAGAAVGESELARVVEDANRRVHELSRGDEALAGMGTTMTAVALRESELAVAHVGDSRAYRLRGGELERLTQDHSLVDELVRKGQLTPEEAEVHPQRSIITRALGPEPDVEVERVTYPARPDDLYLLCSDGLTTMVPEDAISSILSSSPSLEDAARSLVQAANEAGGRDNVTVVLLRLGEGEAHAQAPATGEQSQGSTADQATMLGSDAGALRIDDVRAALEARERERAAEQPSPAAKPPPRAPDTTLVMSPEEAERLRAAQGRHERKPAPARPAVPRRGRLRRFVTALFVLLAVGAVGAGFWAGSRQFYFVGTDDHGLVTLYQGLPYELPLGLELYERSYSTAVPARSLPESRRDRVLDHRLRGKGDAVDLIRQVERGALER